MSVKGGCGAGECGERKEKVKHSIPNKFSLNLLSVIIIIVRQPELLPVSLDAERKGKILGNNKIEKDIS